MYPHCMSKPLTSIFTKKAIKLYPFKIPPHVNTVTDVKLALCQLAFSFPPCENIEGKCSS